MTNLFKLETFTSHSGLKLDWKIDCDALSDADWDCLAYMANHILYDFGTVIGVPTGGLKFAEALKKYITPNCSAVLIADDVLTTGTSMREARRALLPTIKIVYGIVVFDRTHISIPKLHWITTIFKKF